VRLRRKDNTTDSKPEVSTGEVLNLDAGRDIEVGQDPPSRGGPTSEEIPQPENRASDSDDKTKEHPVMPLQVLEPHRSDPVGNLKLRMRKVERVTANQLPEIHFVGQIVSGRGIAQDTTEGCCCR
jgi:hypothetical protein